MKPILFNTEMVQAILEKRKTQTRRVVKPQPDDGGLHNHTVFPMSIQSTLEGWWGTVFETGESRRFSPPHGYPGEILWVREAWNWDWKDYPERTEKWFYYRATTPDSFLGSGEHWKPSIHMPFEACRLFLKVTNVRIERLQDITPEDCFKEGIQPIHREGNSLDQFYKRFIPAENGATTTTKPKTSFRTLWQKINGVKSWELNPWVWVYDFEQTEKPEA